MRIAKATLIEPGRNRTYGIFAVAVSMFCFAYSVNFGQASILLYYALWLPLVAVDYKRVLGKYSNYLWIFAFATVAFLSTFWSQAPAVSMRAAIQYLTCIICGLITARVVDLSTLCKGVVMGAAVVLTYSILFGYYQFDPLDGTYSFVGAFASKNQLGFYASLGTLFAVALVLVLGERFIWLGISGVVGLLSAYALFASQSATSVLTTVVLVALVVGLRGMLYLAPGHRKFLIVGGGVAVVMLAVAGVYLGAVDAVLGIFGKDSTLTGRTYLWQQGIEAAGLHPVFGVGYQAYWVQGFSEPERLWEEFFIGSRSGFHFHNTYIETGVELGLVGIALLAFTLLRTVGGLLKHFITDRRNDECYVLFCVTVLLIIRSFVEIDVLTPYNVGTFLLYVCAGKLALQRSPVAARWQPIEPAVSMGSSIK
ncbi:O-antigen ligase family protein [Oryzifoliimicrobium ureilyticus]|uniref:O-antigen ligase family protein n=1 Tax=Oryzifoliimicrobium ureilyticus TaxID=3113724 RepID=UPI0030766042